MEDINDVVTYFRRVLQGQGQERRGEEEDEEDSVSVIRLAQTCKLHSTGQVPVKRFTQSDNCAWRDDSQFVSLDYAKCR